MARKKLKLAKAARGTPENLYSEIYGETVEGKLDSLKRKSLRKHGSSKKDQGEDEGPANIDSKTTARILRLAGEQLDEVKEADESKKIFPGDKKTVTFAHNVDSEFSDSGSSDTTEEEEYHDYFKDLETDPADEELFRRFAPIDQEARISLSELVMDKINSMNSSLEDQARVHGAPTAPSGPLHKEISEIYGKVATILSRYKSGKLPKVLSVVPHLANCKDIIYLTRPDEWTPQATYMVVKLFINKFEPSMINFFFRDIILNMVRSDIQKNKKLNYHLCRAIKKIAYRPAALFKGIVIPLCSSGTCTLREAAIIAGIIAKISIPMLHSAACILKISSLDYSGASSLFIRVMLDKKYALPHKVIDSLVCHYCKMKDTAEELPVLWNQSLLVFCQRYKNDLLESHKSALLSLIKVKYHRLITPEIRRELVESSRSRDISARNDGAMDCIPTFFTQSAVRFAL